MKHISLLLTLAGIILCAGILTYLYLPIIHRYITKSTQKSTVPTATQTCNNNVCYPASLNPNTINTPPTSTSNNVLPQGGWINSPPLDFKKLQKQNKVTLIEFWTFTCINCIRTIPHTEELWKRYKDYGLVVIGVHSPEFENEKDPQHIIDAIKRLGITYPVVTDAHKEIWNSFNNQYWPAKYLIDPHGTIVYTHFGEGGYAQEERTVRAELEKAGWSLPPLPAKTSATPILEPMSRIQTPELYAGASFMRRPYGNLEQPMLDSDVHFTLPEHTRKTIPPDLQNDKIYLEGTWRAAPDFMQSLTSGAIWLNYLASTVYVVLDTAQEALTVVVELDGAPIPAQLRGSDIIFRDNQTLMRIDGPRLYYPIAHTAPYAHHIITFHVPAGIKLYSFTFGSYQAT